MLATPHLLVGALIGKLTGNYWLALPIAFASHFVLDSIPHTDAGVFGARGEIKVTPGKVIFALIDTSIGVVFVFSLSHGNSVMLAGAGAGLFTDIIDNVPLWNGWLRQKSWYQWFYRLHRFFNGGVEASGSVAKKVFGVVTQMIVLAGAIWFLTR